MSLPLSRREFLKLGAAAGATAALGRLGLAEERAMPMRKLGETGLSVSLFGLGCYPLGRLKSDEDAVRVVSRALEHGVNYLDMAPSYSKGRAESRVAAAIEGKRDDLVLTTKSTAVKGVKVLEELEGSLLRLGTDRVDLFQMHSLRDERDVAERFGPGGAIEGFAKAREDGKARFLGVTGHVDPEVLASALGKFEFDTILLPLNCADSHYLSFLDGTVPIAREKGAGIVAMKVFAQGRLLGDGKTAPTPEECLRYAAALPIATMVLGCDRVEQVDLDARILKETSAPTDEEVAALLARTKGLDVPAIEYYKRRP